MKLHKRKSQSMSMKANKCRSCDRYLEQEYRYCSLECAAYDGALKKPDDSPLKAAILNAVFDEKLKAYKPIAKDDVVLRSPKK